jgi:hypothetical protein
MTSIIDSLPSDLLTPEGTLKDGIQVIDTDSGKVVAPDTNAFPTTKGLKPDDPLFLADKATADFAELRDICLQRTRHKMMDAMKKLSAARICLIREHFLLVGAYNNELGSTALEVALMCTRLLSGDYETDMEELSDTEFDWSTAISDDEANE